MEEAVSHMVNVWPLSGEAGVQLTARSPGVSLEGCPDQVIHASQFFHCHLIRDPKAKPPCQSEARTAHKDRV